MSDEKQIKDGGPAFPGGYPPPGAPFDAPAPTGMTLRDYFAAAALPAVYAEAHRLEEGSERDIAEFAYHMADAMIAVRKEILT